MEMSAKIYLNWFDNLRRLSKREDGYIEQEGLDRLISSLYKHSTAIEIICPESYDSSLLFVLENGEKVLVDNPNQVTFPAYLF